MRGEARKTSGLAFLWAGQEQSGMQRSSYQTLIDRGRKAGLKTAELYNAITARPPEAGDYVLGQADSNGFVTTYNRHGQRVVRPTGSVDRG
jgi:hypothetical protein